MGRTLVVAPLRKEFDALMDCLRLEGFEPAKLAAKTECAMVGDLDLIVGLGGHGKAQLALATQHLIDNLGPFDLVMVAGSSGALADSLRPGDVVVGTETVEHDYRERFRANVAPPRHAGCSDTIEAIRQTHKDSATVRLHFGPIASGDEDIVDADRAWELCEQTGALCVAWEGAGGARAARFNGIPFVEIRAITDAADDKAPDSFRRHVAEAMQNIGRVLIPWLRARVG